MARLFTIGYEGKPANEFVQLLLQYGVSMVIDVRDRPWSRNRAYTAESLKTALSQVSVEYLDLKELGIPRLIRSALEHDKIMLWAEYENILNKNTELIQFLADLARRTTVCLLCRESKAIDCHRHRLAHRVVDGTRGLEITHL